MAIAATDMILRLSTTAGAAGDSTAQASPNSSLGKYASTTVMGTALNSLFDDVSGAENAANTVDYRCVFVLNNHATLTAVGVTVYLQSEVAGGTSIALGVDTTAVSAKGSAGAQAVTVANELTAPAGVTFTAPTTDGAGVVLGDIAPGQVRAFWVKRTAANTAALLADGGTLAFGFDTLP